MTQAMKKIGFFTFLTALLLFSSCSFFKNAQSSKKLVKKEPLTDFGYISTIPMTEKVAPPEINMVMAEAKDLISPEEPHVTPTFFPIVQPYQKMRNDDRGDGYFGASRGRRRHNGLDIITTEGSAVYCPIAGVMKRMAYPYGTGRNNEQWEGCVIEGVGLYKGYEVKIFYMKPFMMGEFVYPNDIVGKAQAISKKYSPAMIDHLHVEVRYKNQLIDPSTLFDLVR